MTQTGRAWLACPPVPTSSYASALGYRKWAGDFPPTQLFKLVNPAPCAVFVSNLAKLRASVLYRELSKSSVFSPVRKTDSDGHDRTDSGRLFQTDAAAAGKARSPMVARTVRGATSADVLEERSCRPALRSKTRWRSDAR